ncbi:TPA: TolC family protein, partial [Legionella pneumophila]
LSFQVKNAYLLAERSAKLVQLIQHTIIPQATLTFTSSQANYGVGKVDFLTMLNNLLTLQENELEYQGELVEHEKAITQIEETTGMYL